MNRLRCLCILPVWDDAGAVRGRGGGLVLPSSGPATGELPVSEPRPQDVRARWTEQRCCLVFTTSNKYRQTVKSKVLTTKVVMILSVFALGSCQLLKEKKEASETTTGQIICKSCHNWVLNCLKNWNAVLQPWTLWHSLTALFLSPSCRMFERGVERSHRHWWRGRKWRHRKGCRKRG